MIFIEFLSEECHISCVLTSRNYYDMILQEISLSTIIMKKGVRLVILILLTAQVFLSSREILELANNQSPNVSDAIKVASAWTVLLIGWFSYALRKGDLKVKV